MYSDNFCKKCRKCGLKVKLADATPINLGRTLDEMNGHTKMCYLCEKCDKKWVEIYNKWKTCPTRGNEWWFSGWEEFMGKRSKVTFIFR